MNHRGNTRKVGERLSLEKGRGRRAPLDQWGRGGAGLTLPVHWLRGSRRRREASSPGDDASRITDVACSRRRLLRWVLLLGMPHALTGAAAPLAGGPPPPPRLATARRWNPSTHEWKGGEENEERLERDNSYGWLWRRRGNREMVV
jgi:hypothetical protein